MLKVDLQKFANTVNFVELNIDKFLEKYNSTNPNNQLKNESLYFVYMNTVSEDTTVVPYLLFKGKNLIGNSGSIVRQATNGLIPFAGVGFEVVLSSDHITEIDLAHQNISKSSLNILFNVDDTTSETYLDVPVNTNPLDFNDVSSDDNKGYLVLSTALSTHLGNINYVTGEITDITGNIYDNATENSLIINYSFLVNIEEYSVISSNLRGFPGQTLFIIDKFEGANGVESINTYMYFWDDTVVHTSGDIQITGQWQNANLNLVSQLSLKNLGFSMEDIRKLKGLLADNSLFAD